MGNLTHTVSGDIASFRSAARVPIESLKCHFKPKQDLHGYDKPWPGGGGKNLITSTEYTGEFYTNQIGIDLKGTSSHASFTQNNNSIIVTTDADWYGCIFATKLLSAGDYKVHLTADSDFRGCVFTTDDNLIVSQVTQYNASSINQTVTLTESARIAVYIGCGPARSTTVIDLQVESGSSYTSWAPYSNICPIEGWNSCISYHKGKNLVNITEDNIIYKNLPVNGSTYTLKNGKITLNVVTANSYMLAFPALELTSKLVGKQVVLSARTIGDGDYGIFLSDLDGNNRTPNRANPYTITSNDIGKLLGVRIRVNGFISTYTADNIQLEFGSVATSYEPYQENIIPITFPITGKNKFNSDSSSWETNSVYCYCKISDNDDVYSLSFKDKDTSINVSDISLGFCYRFPTDGTIAGEGFNWPLDRGVWKQNRTNVVTAGSDNSLLGEKCQYMILYPRNALERLTARYDIQLEVGDTVTEYENPDNTVYGGYFDIAMGEVIATYKKKILNGTENWGTYREVSAPGYHFVIILNDKKVGLNGTISDTFPNANNTYFWDRETNLACFGDHGTLHNLYFNAPYQMTNGVTEWKEWLSENPITIIYPLETPIHYPLTSSDLETFLDQNNIWSNTNNITEVSYQIHDSNMIQSSKKGMIAAQPHIEAPAPTSLQSFTTDMAAPLKECKVYFNPMQEGNGTPSPDNVRAISGWTGLSVNQLPSEYQQIEFIETNYSGSSSITGGYINTGIKPYLGLCSELIIKIKSAGYPLGSGGSSTDYYGWNAATSSPGRIIPYLGTGKYPSTFEGYPLNTFRTLTIIGKKFYVDNQLIYDYANSTNTFNFDNAKELTLGAFNSSTTTMTPIVLKSAKFWDQTTGNYLRYFIPCYRKFDNVVGLYDLVTNTFFTHSGNKEFIAGSNVTNYGATIIDWTSNGTIYGGYVDLINGELIQTYKTRILNGSENDWGIFYHSTYGNTFHIVQSDKKVEESTSISNLYTNVNYCYGSPGKNKYAIFCDHEKLNRWYFRAPNNNITTIPEWQTWLSENNITIVYKLATPITYQLDPIILKTLKGTNNIWSNTNGNIEIKYWTH